MICVAILTNSKKETGKGEGSRVEGEEGEEGINKGNAPKTAC